ncbi:unnamed protein product [Ostreobium quekettii]|uniref:DM10 domain-containing protein n=1 Tax=Ostreobium quekettii TaxID=121088 RepID=A0A8S1JFP3_9CHLO|nr:unnamed protein product [Ostreobium quekettii]|eukprot:evm.model.scf_534.1 EVM.evm.TU.scf_534.1   scf_534:8531-9990(-)
MIETDRFRFPLASDSERRFVLSFYLVDGTLSVFEVPVPNSGIKGGKFLERVLVPKAIGRSGVDGIPAYIASQDLFIGARINVFSRVFEIIGADEFTLGCMEANKSRYPVADFPAVIAKLKKAIKEGPDQMADRLRVALIRQQQDGNVNVQESGLQDAFKECSLPLVKHEVKTISRALDPEGRGIDTRSLMSCIGLE